MSYKVEVTFYFKRQAKRLKKKFPSLKTELEKLISIFEQQPEQGTAIGNSCYKIRFGIASKGKGKSGGARIITHVQIVKSKVYLISIYDKSEQHDISEKELELLLKLIP
ncbi:MAG: type II toxin-antitoxin system RelE/ParE family toxin [Bacteroidota bacterium]